MKYLLLFLCLLPHALTGRDPYFIQKVCGADLQQADKSVDSRLVMAVCMFAKGRGASVHVHSGLRQAHSYYWTDPWASQHATGDALDFRLDYPGKPKRTLTRCQLARIFKYEVEGMLRFLKKHNLYNYVGLGIYPQQNTPFFHLDFRGRKARWTRLDGQYLGIDSGLEFIQEWNRRCGNAERTRPSHIRRVRL